MTVRVAGKRPLAHGIGSLPPQVPGSHSGRLRAAASLSEPCSSRRGGVNAPRSASSFVRLATSCKVSRTIPTFRVSRAAVALACALAVESTACSSSHASRAVITNNVPDATSADAGDAAAPSICGDAATDASHPDLPICDDGGGCSVSCYIPFEPTDGSDVLATGCPVGCPEGFSTGIICGPAWTVCPALDSGME
jgi:hypothetical protein